MTYFVSGNRIGERIDWSKVPPRQPQKPRQPVTRYSDALQKAKAGQIIFTKPSQLGLTTRSKDSDPLVLGVMAHPEVVAMLDANKISYHVTSHNLILLTQAKEFRKFVTALRRHSNFREVTPLNTFAERADLFYDRDQRQRLIDLGGKLVPITQRPTRGGVNWSVYDLKTNQVVKRFINSPVTLVFSVMEA
ncbi:MAG: hypothetical protein ABIE84_01405 [bacterium]